jgi:hypothetical protein
MIQYHPVRPIAGASSGFFKEVGSATLRNKGRISFAIHTVTGECRECGPRGQVTYKSLDDMRDAARSLREKGWCIAGR